MVDADAGDRRGRVVADEFVIVNAEDGDLLGDRKLRLFAGLDGFLRPQVVGREDGGRFRQGQEPVGKQPLAGAVGLARPTVRPQRRLVAALAKA